MNKSREELQKELDETTTKLEQYQHKGQRLENRISYYKNGERKNETTVLSPVARRWKVWPRNCVV